MKKKKDWLKDLEQTPLPCLKLDQEVLVVSGKHAGRRGKVFGHRDEGKGFRLELVNGDEHFFVDSEDIDFKYETVEIILRMPAEQRPAWIQRIKELEGREDEI